MRNWVVVGCIGVLAGYFSHVPHNLSALKLMEPDKSYGQLFREYAKVNEVSTLSVPSIPTVDRQADR